jgi:tetratricopeptide (TPR) repeat protein
MRFRGRLAARFFAAFGCVAALSIPAAAQNSPIDTYLQLNADASAKFSARQWADAISVLEKLVVANPLDGESWGRLGTASYNAKDYRRSIAAYEKQIALGSGIPANAAYNIACDYALMGDKENAILWLQKAFKMGFANLTGAQSDTDLASIKDDPRYRDLVGLIDTTKMSRDEGWRADLKLLVREIKRKGYHLFPRIGTEAEFDASVANLNDSIPKLTDMQVIVEFMKLMHRVGDGHTGLLGGMRAEFLPNLPLQFYLFEEGLFIISADAKYKDLVGSQVIKFGARTPEEIFAGLDPVISRDNEYWPKQLAPYRMRSLMLLAALRLVSDTDKVALTLKGLDGATRTATIVPDNTQPDIWNVLPNPPTWVNLSQVVSGTPPLYMKAPGKAYWYEYLADK